MNCHPDRALSADLDFTGSPKDLMTKFVDCLARLPNLRTLDIFSASHIDPTTRGLKRKRARFPSVRELWIDRTLIKFLWSCPNVESITTTDGFSWESAEILSSRGKELKKLRRLVGVSTHNLLQGKFRDILWLETLVHRRCCYGSCPGLSGPPGDLFQGQDTDYREVCCKSPALRTYVLKYLPLFHRTPKQPNTCDR